MSPKHADLVAAIRKHPDLGPNSVTYEYLSEADLNAWIDAMKGPCLRYSDDQVVARFVEMERIALEYGDDARATASSKKK